MKSNISKTTTFISIIKHLNHIIMQNSKLSPEYKGFIPESWHHRFTDDNFSRHGDDLVMDASHLDPIEMKAFIKSMEGSEFSVSEGIPKSEPSVVSRATAVRLAKIAGVKTDWKFHLVFTYTQFKQYYRLFMIKMFNYKG